MTVQEQFAQIRSSITPEQDKKALRTLWLKSIFILVCFFSSYAVSVYYDGPFWINFVACVIAALSTGAILLNIVHEAVHYTYSKKKSINQLWGFSLTILGSSSILWRERHTHSHHTDTNVINADVDVPPTNQNLIRVSKEQKRMWFHKFQHLYALYIYATFPIFNVFVEEFVALATNKCQVKEKKLRLKIFLEMMLAKVIYIYFYIYTPIEQFGWLKGLIYILVFNFVAGISALFPLIVGHITEGSPMYNKGEKPGWVEHQVSTTINYSLDNPLMTWFTGGNNFHIEHHLFPNINHIHYPRISRDVKKLCEDAGFEYRVRKNFAEALKLHMKRYQELSCLK